MSGFSVTTSKSGAGAPEFKKHNCEVIVGSTDGEYVHLAWAEIPQSEGGVGGLPVPMFADRTGKMARDYGVLIEDAHVALRGLFLIDEKGILRHATINDLAVGRNVEEALRVVAAFRESDSTGAVMPCDWVPGGETIIPDPIKKVDYFKKEFGSE